LWIKNIFKADAEIIVNMSLKAALFVIISSLIALSVGSFVQKELKNVTKRASLSPAEWTEPYEDGLWSTLLEEWTLNNK
jgi:hypothetical protein